MQTNCIGTSKLFLHVYSCVHIETTRSMTTMMMTRMTTMSTMTTRMTRMTRMTTMMTILKMSSDEF